jgi:hypothetical protein
MVMWKRIAGWFIFAIGVAALLEPLVLFLIWGAPSSDTHDSGILYYPLSGGMNPYVSMAWLTVVGLVCLWQGWKLSHPKPKLKQKQ